VPVLISYLDTGLRFCFANAMYKEWLGVRSEDMVGRTISDVFGDAYYREREASLTLALDGQMSNLETRIVRKGQLRVLSTTYIPQLRDGACIGIYVLSTDATASREHERHLMLLVNADPLTGLPNRRMYEEQLSVALARTRRHEDGLALMYLDLDNFKHINDTLGHAAGDAVLIEFGKRIKAVLRDADMLARLAGDEFTVVLQAVDSPADCAVVATKMLAALAAPFVVQGQPLTISASIGVALANRTSTALTLASSADAGLYAAKRAGKNRFNIVAEASHAVPASLH
jgi:diguanylate cyclase (GGDEF)-like protein